MVNDVARLDACIAKLTKIRPILTKDTSLLDAHACSELTETIEILSSILKNTAKRSKSAAMS